MSVVQCAVYFRLRGKSVLRIFTISVIIKITIQKGNFLMKPEENSSNQPGVAGTQPTTPESNAPIPGGDTTVAPAATDTPDVAGSATPDVAVSTPEATNADSVASAETAPAADATAQTDVAAPESSEIPSLDQVAADLASASNDSSVSAMESTTTTDTTPTDAAPTDTATPADGAVADTATVEASPTSDTVVTPEVTPAPAPEMAMEPTPAEPAPTDATTTDATPEALSETAPESTPDTASTSDATAVATEPASETVISPETPVEGAGTPADAEPGSDTANSAEAPQASFGAVENPDLSNTETNLDGTPAETPAENNELGDLPPANDDNSGDNADSNSNQDGGSGDSENSDSDNSGTTSASFVGDAPKPKKEAPDPEDEEPLVPAEPVPGSIGSALAYSDTAPGHSEPVGKKPKKKLFTKPTNAEEKKLNLKTILIIVGAVVLVAAVVIILIFVFNGSGNKTSSSTQTKKSEKKVEPVISSLVCAFEGDGTAFPEYADVQSGEREIIAMYSDDDLTSFGINTTLTYENADIASQQKSQIRANYVQTYNDLGFTTDPFESTYNATGLSVMASRQADGDAIDNINAQLLGLTVSKGEVNDGLEDLQEQYEAEGYTCTVK